MWEWQKMKVTQRVSVILILALGMMLSVSARAETVFVKYRGPVDLDVFSCSYTSSSFVHRICYRPNRQYLVVLLDRTYYHYCRIPPSVVQQWLEEKGVRLEFLWLIERLVGCADFGWGEGRGGGGGSSE